MPDNTYDDGDLDVDEVEDWDPDLDDVIYLKYCFDGLDSLTALAAGLRDLAEELEVRAEEGWVLTTPVDGGWAHIGRRRVSAHAPSL